MKIFKSCKHIEHGLVLDHCNIIRSCNLFNPGYEGRPVLYTDYLGEKINWDNFFNLKNQYRFMFREDKTPPECINCVYCEEKEWDNENYINYLLLTPWIDCNSKCIYCTCHCDSYIKNQTKSYSIYNFIKDMTDNHIFNDDDTIIDFAGGEPTLDNEFEKILKFLFKYPYFRIIIHTNAINYKDSIKQGINNNKVNILVSIDAGTKEIHRKIKGVDSYDKVWKNLKKYSQAQKAGNINVKTKYVIYPGINDSKEEISIWIKNSVNIGIKSVVLNLDFNWLNKNTQIPSSLYELIGFTQQTANQYGIKCELYGSIFQVKTMVEKHVEYNEAGF